MTRTLTAPALRTPLLLLSADLLIGYLAAMLALAAAVAAHWRVSSWTVMRWRRSADRLESEGRRRWD